MVYDETASGEGKDVTAPGDTPFGPRKAAEQTIQFSIEPSRYLTKIRYGWFSNGTQFDDTLFSDVEAGIRLETTATGTDEARIRSAYAGRYISQAEAKPGLGWVVDGGDVTVDSDGFSTLGHGEIYAGAFTWDSANDRIDTGFADHVTSSGWEFVIRSQGSHIGSSPIQQGEWSEDNFAGGGPSGKEISPADGLLTNYPYAWYNQAPIGKSFLNQDDNQMQKAHVEEITGRPSVDVPDLPVQLVVRNDGTAEALGVELGGMQYSTYGAGPVDIDRRPTPEGVVLNSGEINVQKATTDGLVDPEGEPGIPLVSFQRESGEETLGFRTVGGEITVENDSILLYAWDEFNPDSALTNENFGDPISTKDPGKESKLKTDSSATDYAPSSDSTFRGMRPLQTGKNEVSFSSLQFEARVPMGATRVFTAVNVNGTNAGVDPAIIRAEEAY